jgi:transposase
MHLDHADTPAVQDYATIHIAFELSKKKWLLGIMLPGSEKISRYVIAGGDVVELAEQLHKARVKAERCGKPVRIVSCYEAGFDGHWLHRWLGEQGICNYQIDPSSIQVNRRARRAKTDRLDLDQLMRVLMAYQRGEPRVCSILRVPAVEDEDRRRRNRERECLIDERTAHGNRIKGLMHAQGIRDAMPRKAGFIASLAELRTGDGRPLPQRLKEEVERQHARLMLVQRQLNELAAASRTEWEAAVAGSAQAKSVQLTRLIGIGPVGAQGLVNEAFYRSFDNRRQVGSYFGLTGTPFNSGRSERDQGISKCGNRRARELAIELAWLWLRHQPGSALSRWFQERVRDIKGKLRKTTLVALARKLMVALWRYLETGIVPEGVRLRPTA